MFVDNFSSWTTNQIRKDYGLLKTRTHRAVKLVFVGRNRE